VRGEANDLKSSGYKIAEIARVTGKTESEVTREIIAARKPEAYCPTPEEIAQRALEIRRAKGQLDDLT
jgi:IS30 family transposase